MNDPRGNKIPDILQNVFAYGRHGTWRFYDNAGIVKGLITRDATNGRTPKDVWRHGDFGWELVYKSRTQLGDETKEEFAAWLREDLKRRF